MDTLYANLTISMSEFKKNPAHVLRVAEDKPVAVLNHNRPAFYMISPDLFEALTERLEDQELYDLIRQRLTRKHEAVEVDLDSI